MGFNGTEFESQLNFTNKRKINIKILISTVISTLWTSQRKQGCIKIPSLHTRLESFYSFSSIHKFFWSLLKRKKR